ncbi:MAG: spore cortex biosynthesis protein YabQ [Ruminococcus sp.]|nr:spore cortex biosynthesis protein YabQ [Ruminococcus sp.]
MLPTLSEQTVYFLVSIVFGAALSVLYDLVRLIRLIWEKKAIVNVAGDILFFVVAGVLTFLFALPFNKGEVRGFIVLGEAIGFLPVHMTLGAVFSRVSGAVILTLRKFTHKIFKIVKKLFEKLLNFMHFILYNISVIKDRVHRTVSEKKPKSRVRKQKNEQKRKKEKAPARARA